MNVRSFNDLMDLDEVNRWAEAHGLLPIERDTLPPHGLIVPGVAVGFLYRTDSSLGFLDGFMSNPDAPKEQRLAALLHIGNVLASTFHGRHLIVYTAHNGIARWCRENGFTPRGSFGMFSKER